jgi:hypothetical protein
VGEDRDRRDLVGGDVVAQRAGLGPRQPAPGELRAEMLFVGREIEDPAGQRERFRGDLAKATRWRRAAGR